MNARPVSYLQTDPRWGWNDYSAAGEKTTIRASGCGPTAMAMVLATWADKQVTPATECAWALAHGYKCPHSGTYYGYFVPAAKRYGRVCRQLNPASIYGMADAPYHAQAAQALDRGCLVIACMGKGNWTSSGHYVLVYGIQGNTVYINDPASTKAARVKGDYGLFKKQVKYYWVIEPPAKKEDDDMTQEKFGVMMDKWLEAKAKEPLPEWAEAELAEAVEAGITDGQEPCRLVPRYQAAIMALRARKGLH